MKVAIYTGTFKRDQDGVARTLYELVDSLLKRGIEVSVWSPSTSPNSREGLTVHRMPSVPLFLYTEYRFSINFHKIKKEISEFKPDIIHISTPDYIGYRLMMWGKRKDIPIIAAYHTDFPSYLSYFHLNLFSGLVWKYLKRFYRKGDSVLVPTAELKKKLSRKDIRNIRIWSRGIDTEKFNPKYRSEELRKKWKAQEKILITYVGRFVWYKDLNVLIDVYKRFKGSNINSVGFLMIGSGPIADDLKKSMPDAIFTGYLKDEKLIRAFSSGDIFLFPSKTETFGNVVQEAIACGLPAIVSNIGGCQEIVKRSRAGKICEAGEGKNFYDSCKKLIDNKELYQTYKTNGIEYSKHVSWDLINQDLIEHYYNMVRISKK